VTTSRAAGPRRPSCAIPSDGGARDYVGLAFILVHFAISANWDQFTPSNALAAPLLVWFGMAAMLSLVALVATSVWRKPLRLSYEAWHVVHAVLAVVLVVGAVGHIIVVDEYVSTLWKQVLWALMSGAFVCLLVWVRVIKPRRALARPWRVARVTAERGDTTSVALTPPPGIDFRFQPGQFAWFAIDRSPFSLTQHPFSFSSSSEQTEVEVAIKALGDLTSTVRSPSSHSGRACPSWPSASTRYGRGARVWRSATSSAPTSSTSCSSWASAP
jgi:predicted ferric reductase